MDGFRTGFSVFLLLIFSVAAWAATAEVVELRYRTAAEMIAVVQPHLAAGESASGLDNKLVLRVRPENREAILALVRQLDTRPVQLKVSVRQGSAQQQTHSEAGASGRYQTGNATIQIGADQRPLSGRVIQHQTRGDSEEEQQVRVLDGQPAAFYVGHLIPVPGGTAVTPHGYVLHEGIYYQEVVRGFEVRPRVSGQTVLLDIRPRREQYQSDGSITLQSVNTVVDARLGEWVDIGEVVESFAETQTGIASYGSTQGSHSSRVEIKVERD